MPKMRRLPGHQPRRRGAGLAIPPARSASPSPCRWCSEPAQPAPIAV